MNYCESVRFYKRCLVGINLTHYIMLFSENISNKSSSAIANKHRYVYDCFNWPLPYDGYLPNKRLRDMFDKLQQFKENNDLHILAIRFPPKSSSIASIQIASSSYPKHSSSRNQSYINSLLSCCATSLRLNLFV